MSINSVDFDYLRQLVRDHSAVALDPDKEYLAELHIEPLAELVGFNSIASLVAHLKNQPFGRLHQRVAESLLTYETSFFRDTHPFEALKNFILPELIKQRECERSLNIWCGACSSGQEPYSIAMLIKSQFPSLNGWKIRIIASDVSQTILDRARKGRYSQLEINRGLPAILREKYFSKQGNEWQISEQILSMVEFHQINLLQPSYPLPKMDVIFLRNVLIYFDSETKINILKKIRQLLKSDGCLFLGGGETTINLDNSYERVLLDKTICHRLQAKS